MSDAAAGPSRPRHHPTTPAEQQAAALSQLLAHPEREIKLPGPPKEKTLRAPRETIKNVTGSSAGAGSGEFHVYKHARRREYERIKLMEEKDSKDKETSQFLIQQAQQAAKDDAKTSKNRAKRDKKKMGREKAKLAAQGEGGATSGAEKRKRVEDGAAGAAAGGASEKVAAGEKRMRAAPGSEGIAFRAKDQGSDDEEEDEEGDASS